jgi:type IV pilus assembly protein PilC
MHDALESLMRIQSDSLSIWVTPEIHKRVIHGHRLSASLAQFPRVFPSTYVAMIRASEETGKLVAVLDRLGDWLDRREEIQRHVKKALTYPVLVILVAFVLTLGLFKTVIPGILETVIGLGVDLPGPTKLLLWIVYLVEQPLTWFALVALIATMILYSRTPQGWERILFAFNHVPVLGGVLMYSSTARYSHTMSMLLDSGVDIIRAAKISADASGSPLIRLDSNRITKELREGRYYNEILGGSPVYPPLLTDMVEVGDESGYMAAMLKKCGELLEQDTMHRIDIFLNLLEPLVLAAVSVGIGFVVVAVLMPMSSIVSAL